MAKKRQKSLPYFRGLKRVDSNFNGLIENGFGQLQSGGGFANFATGLGTFSRDKVMQGFYYDQLRLADAELTALFHGNGLAARIVELKPKEMFRRGYSLCIPDPDGDAEGGQNKNDVLAHHIEEYARNLRADDIIKDGMIWGRLFGGSLVILGVDDGQDVKMPVNEKRIRSIKYMNLIDRRFLFAHTYYSDPFAPKFGEVETYQVTNAFGDQQQSIVHETRVLRFDGSPVDILKRRQLTGWTLSVLQRPYNTLRQFDTSFQAVANLMTDASQAVFKMQGLMEQIASGEYQTLQTRMAIVDMSRSSARAVLLDKDNEEFERTTTSFAGIPDTLDRFMTRMASDAEMPVTILFGREPSGLNATGVADFQHFYDTIASEQKNMLEPVMLRLYKLICLAKDSPTNGVEPTDGLEIHWKPLKEPNDLERAEIYGKMATADSAYVTAQVLLPEEVGLSRFANGEFNLSTKIDVKTRLATKDNELQFAKDASNAKLVAGPAPQPHELTGEESNPQQAPPGTAASTANPQTGRAP